MNYFKKFKNMADDFEDYLINYDPDNCEIHADSSEFDVLAATFEGKRKKLKTMKNSNQREEEDEKMIKNMLYFDNCGIEFVNHQKQKTGKKIKTKAEKPYQTLPLRYEYVTPRQNCQVAYDVGDKKLNFSYSKSLLRKKVMPCLSSIFNRPKKKDKQVYNNLSRDNVYNAEFEIGGLRKYGTFLVNKRHAMEDSSKGLSYYPSCKEFSPEQSPDTLKNQYSYTSCDLTSSVESNKHGNSCHCKQNEEGFFKGEKFREFIEMEVKKELMRHQSRCYILTSTQSQQYPSGHLRSFTSRSHEQRCINYTFPSKSSHFWDFCFHKIYELYQNKKTVAGCKKENSLNPSVYTVSKENKQCCSTPLKVASDTKVSSEKNCPQPPSACPPPNISNQQSKNSKSSVCRKCPVPDSPKNNSSCRPLRVPKEVQTSKIKCECSKKPKKQKTNKKKNKSSEKCCSCSPTSSENSKVSEEFSPCQQPHGDIKKILEEKFQKEILCIHNPPFVLINGCLTMPSKVDSNKIDLFQFSEKLDHGCQFSNHHYTGFQCQTSIQKTTEKMSQGGCQHQPPCEVVPCCWRPKQKNYLQEMPEYLLQKDIDLERLSKCEKNSIESQKSKKEYVVLTARENVCTQVMPKADYICRHEPKCVLIPKCLSKTMYCNLAPSNSFPNCMHSPICDMIPACCRANHRGMVSTSSQYPGSCRMV